MKVAPDESSAHLRPILNVPAGKATLATKKGNGEADRGDAGKHKQILEIHARRQAKAQETGRDRAEERIADDLLDPRVGQLSEQEKAQRTLWSDRQSPRPFPSRHSRRAGVWPKHAKNSKSGKLAFEPRTIFSFNVRKRVNGCDPSP